MRPGIRALLRLESDLEYFERVAGPKARVRALNRLRVTMKARVARELWQNLRYLPLVDSKGRKIREKNIRTGVKLKHIRDRIFTSQANKRRPFTRLIVYTTPIPAIRLTSSSKGGTTTTKGQFMKRKGGRRAAGRSSKLGGLSIGGVIMPNAFIQFSKRNQTFHVFRRNQRATWLPGKSGWDVKPGSNQFGLRHSYDTVKFDIHEAANKHTAAAVEKVVQERAALEYNRALEQVGAQLLKYGR
jgi:hypothetical protein